MQIRVLLMSFWCHSIPLESSCRELTCSSSLQSCTALSNDSSVIVLVNGYCPLPHFRTKSSTFFLVTYGIPDKVTPTMSIHLLAIQLQYTTLQRSDVLVTLKRSCVLSPQSLESSNIHIEYIKPPEISTIQTYAGEFRRNEKLCN